MNTCNLLDDYLIDALDEPHRRVFESHLPACPACAEEVRLTRRIDEVLAISKPAAPPDLTPSISLRLKSRSRRRLSAAVALAAAALLCVLGVWKSWRLEEPPSLPDPPIVKHAPSPLRQLDEPRPESPLAPLVTVDTGADVIALEQPSDDPTVHIYWLYPTLKVSAQDAESPVCSTQLERKSS